MSLRRSFTGCAASTTIADAYLRNARACYEQWGAVGKVNQIDGRFPHLPKRANALSSGHRHRHALDQMDCRAVMRASQALSSEMNLPSLIETLLRLALEHAGAQRGLLILLHDGEPLCRGGGHHRVGQLEVTIRQERIKSSDLPQSVLHYVLRTQERVLQDDASADNLYSKDEYLRDESPKIFPVPSDCQTNQGDRCALSGKQPAPDAFTSDGSRCSSCWLHKPPFRWRTPPLYRSATPSWAAAASPCIRLDAQTRWDTRFRESSLA